jgi:hypothetical protein
MAPTNNTLFMTLSVYVRGTIIVWFTLFVLLDWISPSLIVFGLIDLLAAGWTYLALRKG